MNRLERWSGRRRGLLPLGVILLVTAWAFWPVARSGWLWDDSLLVTENTSLRSVAGLREIWAGASGPDYFPLTATVQWLQWHLWGDRPAGYHLTNLLLHFLSGLLVWRLLGQLLGASEDDRFRSITNSAWLGGLLFIVHPLTVESVAWISELKNALSLPLMLASLSAYISWERSGASGEGQARGPRRKYAASLLCFVAAMLSKTSVVMLPCILLLYGWWRNGRVRRRDLVAAAPFFAVSLTLGLVTVWFQRHRGMEAGILPLGGAVSRLGTAGLSCWFYLAKFILPWDLRPVYPRWAVNPPSLRLVLPFLALASAIGWMGAGSGGGRLIRRHVAFGFGFFLINLAPIVGLVPVAYFHISWVADHFCYVPVVGLIAFTAAAAGLVRRPLRTWTLGSVAGVALAALWATQCRAYATVFQSEESLWSYTLGRDPGSWFARYNLGKVLLRQGRVDESLPMLEEAAKISPAYAAGDIDLNLGTALAQAGRPFEAITRLEEDVRLRPEDAEGRSDLGNLLSRVGRLPEAIEQHRRAVRLRPQSAELHDNLGVALTRAGRLDEAVAECGEAVRLDPTNVNARYNWGVALGQAGRNAEAAEQFEQVVRAAPERADAHNNLGIALAGLGRLTGARAEFERALGLRPDFTAAAENLARTYRTGKEAAAR